MKKQNYEILWEGKNFIDGYSVLFTKDSGYYFLTKNKKTKQKTILWNEEPEANFENEYITLDIIKHDAEDHHKKLAVKNIDILSGSKD
ncbi:hypothetical protein JYK00_04655 [Thermosipho ferrireducens]|uniref:Uncharacterized protein n=1 Tax=Thermosipho ferrireducens TaxID=2571116 RepID=A0ABX7S879_9BACT|nr:hypothetical protein [Thermosipho ferrireducens]QTA38802.1 hypothetical protein JYK00_04655 [Thermosipho ferrireducens]